MNTITLLVAAVAIILGVLLWVAFKKPKSSPAATIVDPLKSQPPANSQASSTNQQQNKV